MSWFRSDTFKEASKLAKVTGRSFYLAQPQAVSASGRSAT